MTDAPRPVFIKGNEAVARGALAAGLRCYFGYPITPQNEIPELLSKLLPEVGGEFVQAESELAAANMLLGASAAGVRAMTSSSSPGISLKQETISYMAGSLLPGVIVNMTRGGPGLGDIGTSQGDYFQSTRGGGHGDYRTLVLAPAGCQEAYDLTVESFDLAFRYRQPVLILGDATLGQMKEPVSCWQPDPATTRAAEAQVAEWRLDGAARRPRRVHKSLWLEEGSLAARNLRLADTYRRMEAEVRHEAYATEDAELVVVAFGTMGRIAKGTVKALRRAGHRVGLVRPISLFPFPSAPLAELAAQGKRFLTIEHNLGQMVDDVRLAVRRHADSAFHPIYPGNLPLPDDLEGPILEALAAKGG